MLEVWITHPPYRAWRTTSEAEITSGGLKIGAILGLDGGLGRDPKRVEQRGDAVRGLRSTFPWIPLVLRVKDSRAASIHAVRAAGDLGFSGVVGDDEPLREALQQDLCDRPRPPALQAFLRACFPEADASVRDEALSLLLSGLEWRGWPALSEREPGARAKRLHREGLPAPGAILRSGRLISVVLDAQRDHSLELPRLAQLHGYASGSSLDRALLRRFRAGIQVIRPTLGWQPWLARAVHGDAAIPVWEEGRDVNPRA